MSIYIVSHIQPINLKLPNGYKYILGGKYTKSNNFGRGIITHDEPKFNISSRNRYYAEISSTFAIYQLIKDGILDDEIVGLYHYRRYLTDKNISSKIINKLNKKFDYKFKPQRYFLLNYEHVFRNLKLNNQMIFLPKKIDLGLNVIDNYAENHNKFDLLSALEVTEMLYPHYLDAINEFKSSTKFYAYNMFIMNRIMFVEYCNWLFKILFEVEKIITIENTDEYQARVFGYLSERLFNIWILNKLINNQLIIEEVDVVRFEGAF